MKTAKFLKLAGVFGFALMLTLGVSAQSTTPTFTVDVNHPDYATLKAEFYQAHPELLNPTSGVSSENYPAVPGFVPTGNEEVDAANYQAAKLAQEPVKVDESALILISRADYDAASAEKKAVIDASPDVYRIIED